MEKPKPTPVHKRLEVLAGTWSGEETMYPSPWMPEGGVLDASLKSRVACDGFWIVGDYEQRQGNTVVFRGVAVFGADPQTQEVTLHWFDSMGTPADAFRGKFDGTKLTLNAKSAMGQHRLTYDFSDKAHLRSRMEVSSDGKQWKPAFDGVYTHKP